MEINEIKKTFTLLFNKGYYINVDNSSSQSHNINIDRPQFFCFALSKEEAIGKMMLSNFSYKHKPIVSVTEL